MSERHDIANRLAARITEEGLTNPLGGDVMLSEDNACYTTVFMIPRMLDGFVGVYSPKFILITGDGPMGLGFNGVFDQEVNALEAILCLAQIGGRKRADADEVPRKMKK